MSAPKDDLFAALGEALSAPVAASGAAQCSAKDRNATCVRVPAHDGWHRSKTGVVWPNRAEVRP